MPDIKDQLFDSTRKIVSRKEFLPTAGGGVAGWVIGSSIGIAAMGSAVAGSFVLAPIGGIIGLAYAKGYRITRKSESEQNSDQTDL